LRKANKKKRKGEITNTNKMGRFILVVAWISNSIEPHHSMSIKGEAHS
jgi:hypothetical protein